MALASDTGVRGDNGVEARADIMTPRGTTKRIEFDTEVGTEMSLDVSPDGKWLVFDLLGHVYRMSIAGGAAQCLTQGSGVALNLYPRYSPDGSRIVFVSDRTGQLNVWTMNADGSAPRAVHVDPHARYYDPTFAPDGRSIVAVRGTATPGRGWHRRNAAVFRLPLEGKPEPLLSGTLQQYFAPSFSPDGNSLYVHTATMASRGLSIAQSGFHLLRFDLSSGQVAPLRAGDESTGISESPRGWQAQFGEVEQTTPTEIEPHVSPDGKLLAFARSAPDSPLRYRHHLYRPGTELVLRDLSTGDERVLRRTISNDLTRMHAIYADVHLPSFAWTPDSRFIVIANAGRMERIAVADGRSTAIPFKAHVLRIVSEQAKSAARIADQNVRMKFIQSPVTSPDRRHIAFAADGRIWLASADGSHPAPVFVDDDAFQYTPSWSPDSKQLAFTSWGNVDRGHVWIRDIAGNRTTRATSQSGEYLYPVWSADGRSLNYLAGVANSAPDDIRTSPWRTLDRWQIRRQGPDGIAMTLTEISQPSPLSRSEDGRIYFPGQLDPQSAQDLNAPYPADTAMAQYLLLSSIAAGERHPRVHARFPAMLTPTAQPVLSPDGRWLLFEADHALFVEPAILAAERTVDTNPNRASPHRQRLDEFGGIDPHWLDNDTVEYAAGSSIVRHNVRSKQRSIVPIELVLPRARPSGTIALRGGSLVTLAPGSPDISRGDIVIRGARIECVGRCDLSNVDRVLDVSGKTIIPGLIDVHSHTLAEPSRVIPTYRSEAALNLAYGVTSTIDPSTSSDALFPIADLVDTGRLLGPRSFGAAEPVIDSALPNGGTATGIGDRIDVDSPQNARYQVERRATWGAAIIKNYRQGRRENHQLLLDAARTAGIAVTGEGGSVAFDLSLAMDGQTGWEHAIPSLPIHADVARFMGAAGITYSPTAIIAGHLSGSSAYFRPRSALLKDARHRRFLPIAAIEAQLARTPQLRAKDEFSFPLIAEGLADIVSSGGYGAIGEHGEQPGLGSHWELWAYAEALKPIDALRVATLHGARFVGLDTELGSLEPGKLADLVVLDANPLRDIRNSIRTSLVMKGGLLFDASTLQPLWSAAGHSGLERTHRLTTSTDQPVQP